MSLIFIFSTETLADNDQILFHDGDYHLVILPTNVTLNFVLWRCVWNHFQKLFQIFLDLDLPLNQVR
jgi:hypothetical protein